MWLNRKLSNTAGRLLGKSGSALRTIGNIGLGVNSALHNPLVRGAITAAGVGASAETGGISGLVAGGLNYLGSDKFKNIASGVKDTGTVLRGVGNKLKS